MANQLASPLKFLSKIMIRARIEGIYVFIYIYIYIYMISNIIIIIYKLHEFVVFYKSI